MLGLGWFRMKLKFVSVRTIKEGSSEQISAFSEFCNVGARPVYALSF
jgi:hypothetical protein